MGLICVHKEARVPTISTCGRGILFTYEGDLENGIVIEFSTGPSIKISSRFLKEAIAHFKGKEVKGGFLVDNPPHGGFGEWVKNNSRQFNNNKPLTPAHGSRIAAILEHMGYLRCRTEGKEGVILKFGVGHAIKNDNTQIQTQSQVAMDDGFDYVKLPEYYKNYRWSGKHKLFGYPPDTFPEFLWIASLEKRFAWVVSNYSANNSASKYLLQEMIEWGGSQNGILQKFNDGCGEVNLFKVLREIVSNLSDPQKAISSALRLPGLGLTYASKLLRFMQPEMYGALDAKIRKALNSKERLARIYDGNHESMVSGYVEFVGLLQEIKKNLKTKGIKKPACGLSKDGTWRASEIEMALFCWANSRAKLG
jgi:hypothetical protein